MLNQLIMANKIVINQHLIFKLFQTKMGYHFLLKYDKIFFFSRLLQSFEICKLFDFYLHILMAWFSC
jgi:hypothetical protein